MDGEGAAAAAPAVRFTRCWHVLVLLLDWQAVHSKEKMSLVLLSQK